MDITRTICSILFVAFTKTFSVNCKFINNTDCSVIFPVGEYEDSNSSKIIFVDANVLNGQLLTGTFFLHNKNTLLQVQNASC